MRLHPSLARWTQHGLIDEQTAADIAAFESQRGGLHPALMAISGLGGFAILLGSLALIGANWAWFPNWLKLGGTFATGCALAGGLWWTETRTALWISETLRGLFVGWVIAAIAVVGQVFQLNGTVGSAITWWVVLAAPVFSGTRSHLGGVGFISLLFAGCFGVQEVLFGEVQESTLYWLPIVFPALMLGLLNHPLVQRHRPELAGSGTWTLSIGAVGYALVAVTVVSHSQDSLAEASTLLPLGIGLLASAGLVSRWTPRPGPWTLFAMGLTYAMACSWVIGGLNGGDLLATALAVGLLGSIAASAHERGHSWLVKLSTLLIACRLFLMYLVYAANLNSLGLSLLGGGGLMVVLAGIWYRSMQRLGGSQ